MRKIIPICSTLLLAALSAQAEQPLSPTRFLDANGMKVAVYESSGLGGPGILLLHGTMSSANAFAKIMRSDFAKKNRVVAFDLPGFGRSENAFSYNADLFVKTIAQVAILTKVDRGVIVGWSLGGDFALQASRELPSARGYFLVSTAPVGAAPELPSPFLTPEESYAGAAVNYPFIDNLTRPQIQQFANALFQPGYKTPPDFFLEDAYRADPAVRAAVFAAATGRDPSFLDEIAVAKGLRVPLALVMGEYDFVLRPAYLQGLASQLPTLWQQRVITVNGSGHAVPWEQPDCLLALLQNFIDAL